MESSAWSRSASAAAVSKRHHSAAARCDPYLGFEEIDGGDDDGRVEFSCPFCAEDFDIIGLCCHIDDEHPVEAENGTGLLRSIGQRHVNNLTGEEFAYKLVCPVCAARVGMDMVEHLTMQHGSFFKTQRRRRFHKNSSGSRSMLSLLRKELRDGNLQALLGGSSYIPPPAAEPDPFLSSLIYTLPVIDPSKDVQTETFNEGCLVSKSSHEKVEERPSNAESSLSDKDHKERTQRSEFVQGLLLSTIFEDNVQ